MSTNIIPRKTVTDLQQIFAAPPQHIIQNNNQKLVLADEVLHEISRSIVSQNRAERMTADGIPMPVHEAFAIDDDASGYGIPTDDIAGESFDFAEFTNTL